MLMSLSTWIHNHFDWWTAFGMAGQMLFMSRMLVQWVASEKARRSVVPAAFWYLSLVGGMIVLAYGIQRNDLVIIFGQMFGVIVYVRNIYFIWQEKAQHAAVDR